MADLDAASFKDVEQWFKTYYGPPNVVLVLAGDIDTETAKAKVEKYFGDIPPGPPVPHQQVWIAKMTGTHREVTRERVPLPRIYMVWNVPQFGSLDSDYLDLVSSCLGQGKTSRLYKRLIYDEQIASDIGIFNDAREIGGQFVIQVTARPGHTVEELEKAINEELARFVKNGPAPEELQRVQTQYLASFLRGVERIGGFGGSSDRLAQYAVYTGDPGGYKLTLKRVREATAEDLKSVANRWLTDGVYIADVLPFPDYRAASVSADRSKTPALGAPPELKLPKLQRATLSNGLKVVLAERHDVPLVNLWLATDAGYAADQFAKPGTAKLAGALLVDGTRTRSALEINDQTALLGAELRGYSGLDFSYLHLSALKANLAPSVELFADVIQNPIFPEADFERERKLQLDAIEQEQKEPFSMALRVFQKLLYGSGHAYANPLTGSGTAASVKQITRADLVKFHETWLRPNNSTLVVAGDTTLGELTPKLERLFDAWKAGPVPTKNISEVQLAAKPAVYIVNKPGASQSVILAGQVSTRPDAQRQPAIQAMIDDIAGTFGSRLNMNLREDKHWAYGAFGFLWGARAQRPFLIFAPVQTDKTKESLAEVNKELRAFLTDRPVTAEELARIQANETLSLPGSRETLNSVGSSIMDLLQYGWPDDYYESLAGRIRVLKTADLDAAAKMVIHPDVLVWVVVGDRAKIESGVRELGFGEIRFLDADGNPVW
jgi:zinc protease